MTENEVCGCGAEGCHSCESFWLSQLTPEQRLAYRRALHLEELAIFADARGEWELANEYADRAAAFREELWS